MSKIISGMFLTTALLLPVAVQAQNVLPGNAVTEQSSLDDLVAYALLHHAGLGAAHARWHATVSQAKSVGYLPNPTVSVGLYLKEVETRTGPQKSKISFSQKLPWWGKLRLASAVTAKQAEMEFQYLESLRREVTCRVKVGYYDYSLLLRSQALISSNLALLKRVEQSMRTGLKVGRTTQANMVRMQIEIGKLEDRLRSLSQGEPTQRAQLNLLLNRDFHALLPRSLEVPVFRVDYDKIQLMDSLLKRNPDLLASDIGIDKSERALSLSKKGYYPDLSIGLTYIQTDPASNASAVDSGADPLIFSLGMSIPLWQGKNRAAESRARHLKKVAILYRENLIRRRQIDVERAMFTYEDTLGKVALYEDALLPKALEAYHLQDQLFSVGKSTFLDLIDSQRMLIEMQLSVETFKTKVAQAHARLKQLIGDIDKAATMLKTSPKKGTQP